MALGTDHFTPTDLAEYIPEVWGTRVNDFYRPKLKFANFFTNRSDELAEGGDTLHTPNLSEMTANAKVNGSQVTLNSPTFTGVSLVVDQWFEVSFLIEDKEAAQVKKSLNTQERMMKNAAHTAAKKLETAIATLFQSFSVSVGSTGVALTAAVVLQAISSLESVDADYEEAAWLLHPKTYWVDLVTLDRFALAINTADAANPVMKTAPYMIHGRPVLTSTTVTKINTNADYAGALAVPDAVHWATSPLPGARDQFGVRLQASYIQEYLGTLVTADLLYGVIENRDAGGIRIVSKVAA
jgi:hypothetical protein